MKHSGLYLEKRKNCLGFDNKRSRFHTNEIIYSFWFVWFALLYQR